MIELTPREPLGHDWPELALGNLVVLKKPYMGGYDHGIIVQHLHGDGAIPRVSLYVYCHNPIAPPVENVLYANSHGGLWMPDYVDFRADEFRILKSARTVGYPLVHTKEGWDLYPRCGGCGGTGLDASEDVCRHCRGLRFGGPVHAPGLAILARSG